MSENGGPIKVSDGNFAEEIEKGQGLSIVDFWAAWCGPCRMVAPIIEQLAGEYAGRMKVAKLDVDTNIKTATRFNVRSIPMVIFFKDGKVVDQVIGASHTLEPISDPETIQAIQRMMAEKKVWIADGHHRYETACTFRESTFDEIIRIHVEDELGGRIGG